MTETVGEEKTQPKASYPSYIQRNAICMYRKISEIGCKGCRFWMSESLCVRSPRTYPSTTLIED